MHPDRERGGDPGARAPDDAGIAVRAGEHERPLDGAQDLLRVLLRLGAPRAARWVAIISSQVRYARAHSCRTASSSEASSSAAAAYSAGMSLAQVGLWTASLDGVTAGDLPRIAADVDTQGWSSLWFGEAYGREAFTAAGLLLSAGGRLRVGTGIANIYGRDAIACAAAARTLDAVHPGRFVLGLGVSHAPLVERLRGHEYGRPLQEMGAYLDALLAAPAIVPGEEHLPPVVLAALGPRMLELAAARTQGALPYLVLPEHTAQARAVLGDGAQLVVEQAVVVTPDIDEDAWRHRAHEHLELYTGLPNYRTSFLRQGFTEGDLVRGGSESLKRAMVPFGVEAARARIDAHLAAGADEVVVQVLGPTPLTPPRSDWALLADALR